MRLDGAKADEFLESVVQSGGNIELEVHGKRFVLQLLEVKDEAGLDRDDYNEKLAKRLLDLNPEVKRGIVKSREEYVRGEYFTTDDLLNEIDRGEL